MTANTTLSQQISSYQSDDPDEVSQIHPEGAYKALYHNLDHAVIKDQIYTIRLKQHSNGEIEASIYRGLTKIYVDDFDSIEAFEKKWKKI